MNSKKIFVGNVPFNCTPTEFRETFANVEGYKEGDIIINPNTNMCKGYGFLVFDTVENAEKIKKRKDVVINTRKLRFMNYSHNDVLKNTNNSIEQYPYNYIFVEGIPDGVKREYLKEIFLDYTLVGYYINTNNRTGQPKNYGRIELKNYEDYKTLLEKTKIEDDNNILKLSKWNYPFNYTKKTH